MAHRVTPSRRETSHGARCACTHSQHRHLQAEPKQSTAATTINCRRRRSLLGGSRGRMVHGKKKKPAADSKLKQLLPQEELLSFSWQVAFLYPWLVGSWHEIYEIVMCDPHSRARDHATLNNFWSQVVRKMMATPFKATALGRDAGQRGSRAGTRRSPAAGSDLRRQRMPDPLKTSSLR